MSGFDFKMYRPIHPEEATMKHNFWNICVISVGLLLLVGCNSSEPFPLSEPGPYQFGSRMNYKFTDASREDREVSLYIWYPAVIPESAEPSKYNFDAEPDLSGAPYPVILSSAKSGMYFGPHLASHGFVVVGVDGQDPKDNWGPWLIDYPLDQVYALEHVVENPPDGLEGMIDAEHAGAMGYSFDGYNALALGGARVDPEFYQEQCASSEPGNPEPKAWWIEYICNLDGGWEALVNSAGSEITTNTDGLWQPLTDERIQAVMPMAPEGAWLFGERGLAAVDRPTLIIAATADDINYYDLEAVYIFEYLGTSEKSMVSFIDQEHLMIMDDEQVAKMHHLASAFFGYHLHNNQDYEKYLSEKYVSKQEGLAWGMYGSE
jgi:predicted dienelactone hydrolase